MEELLAALTDAEATADRNAGLVTAQGWAERQVTAQRCRSHLPVLCSRVFAALLVLGRQ